MDTITQLELTIPEAVHENAWQNSQTYSTPRAKWNAYLNQVCLETVLPWLQAEHAADATGTPGDWELVTGSVINFNHKRLILIPDKSIDTREFRVPQEWVDIPSWVGDYYLAVQVNPDDLSVRIRAYTTHEQLKTIGKYDASDRTYYLDAQDLVEDMTVLWVVQQLCPDEPTQASLSTLPTVPEIQAENLLQRLSNPDIDQPRLELPVTLWEALLESPTWRQQLSQLRQGVAVEQHPISTLVTNLRGWVEHRFATGWQTLEEWFNPEEFAVGLRQTQSSESTIQRVKPVYLPDQTILLVVALTPEADGRISIRALLRPMIAYSELREPESIPCLPANLRLSLISDMGVTIQSVETREQDNSIQLRRFKCHQGTQFSLQVALSDTVVTEAFES